MSDIMNPVWTHPASGATLWVGNRHFSRAHLEGAAIGMVVSTYEPPAFLPGWVADDRRHHVFLFEDTARLPDVGAERVAVGVAADALEGGANVLIHCKGGLNRSAYLAARTMVALGMEPGAAVARIRQRRSPRVLGNRTFLDALIAAKAEEGTGRASVRARLRRRRQR